MSQIAEKETSTEDRPYPLINDFWDGETVVVVNEKYRALVNSQGDLNFRDQSWWKEDILQLISTESTRSEMEPRTHHRETRLSRPNSRSLSNIPQQTLSVKDGNRGSSTTEVEDRSRTHHGNRPSHRPRTTEQFQPNSLHQTPLRRNRRRNKKWSGSHKENSKNDTSAENIASSTAHNQRDFTSLKKSKVVETLLYVRIHDVIDDIGKLGDILTAKVDTEGVLLHPTDTAITRSDTFTYCFMTCPTKALAKKLRNLLLKDKHKFTPLIDCSFEPFEQDDVKRKNLQLAKELLKKQVTFEFDKRVEQVLRAHNPKLQKVLDMIDKAKHNLRDLHKHKETKQEIEALEHKQAELENQREEFKRALGRFRDNLTILLEKDSFERDIQNLRKKFGVECCRMEKPLPVYARRHDIIELVQNNQVSIIVAETGSGKSTQIVQYLLEAQLADKGTIVCTQPRKVAAISLATHVAKELATNVGREVGYKVGSTNRRSESTKVVFMTDHALLNECLGDPDLGKFSCIVVDEAHERSLYTDLLLGMIKRCLKKRPELRVIITSATIDPQVFVDFFGGVCPVMKISGRTFPVEVVWEDVDSEEIDFDQYEEAAVKKAIEIHTKEPPGDILVFLTSRVEIEKCIESFEQRMKNRSDFQCFPLHGQLQPDEQQKVFEPLGKNKRKIVFATNCAETSITIDGIKYVVDTGVAKEMRYDARKNVNALNVTIISRSSADQRKGRAGRTAPGKCYRLYSQSSFQAMDTISLPEILKTHLGQALLKLAQLGIGPDMYDFVQSPSADAISAALESLVQLGAMEDGKITETGRWMARLPFDPKLGLLTLLGKNEEMLYDAIVLAAVINAGSGVFYRGTVQEALKKFDKAKSKFSSSGGDFLTSLAVYKEWLTVPEKQKNKWCMENSINAKTVRGIRDNINDVVQVLGKELKLEIASKFSEVEKAIDVLQKMVFKCYSANLCHYLGLEKAGYFAARANRQVHVHPSSSQNALASFPEWVVYDQIMKTSRDFITGITPVEDSWLSDITREKFGIDVEEIRKKKLLNVYTQPAGSHAFFALIGPRYTRLRGFEEQFSDSSGVVIVEASRERGELKVFSTAAADALKDLTHTLEGTVQEAVKQLEKDHREMEVGKEESGLRVVLGLGGQVVEILMPNESRKVFITRPSEDATKETITCKFQKFGEITFCKQFPQGKQWGLVIFRSAEAAARAAEMTKNDDCDAGDLERRRPAKHNAEFKARLSWCRRPCKGFGFVEVSPLYLSQFMQKGHFWLGDKQVKIRLDCKKEESLYLTGFPTEVTEDVVKRALLYAVLGDENAEDIVTSVRLIRDKVEKTTQKQLKALERQIREAFEARLQSSTVQVNIRNPDTEHRVTFSAEAYFSDPIEGIRACRALRNFRLNNGQCVEVTPIISATLTVQQRILDACQGQYSKVLKHLIRKDVEIELKPLKSNNMLVSIKAMDLEDAVKARTFLNDVFKGDVLDCNASPNLQHLLTAAGRRFLQETEQDTEAYVCVDNRLRTIAIHGSDQACTKVRIKMNEYLDVVLSGTVEEVVLKGSDNPPGLLKTIITTHGDDLDGFRTAVGLHSVTVDYRRHKVKLTGTPDSLQKAKDQIQQLKDKLWAACKETRPKEDDLECPACTCPIEMSELYRLEICAHPYCRSCLQQQVTIAIKDRSLPVVCCNEGCGRPLAWRDFNNLARVGDIKLPALTTAAIAAFVVANRDVAHFCTTPDCPMVYRVSSEDKAEVFQCPECSMRTCTACHAQSHDGVTCAMLRSSKNQEQDVEAWARQDRKRRRVCPGCKSPIEKIGGCNKMLCEVCHAIFCWHCLQKFRSAHECYNHLTDKHGAIFALEDILYDG